MNRLLADAKFQSAFLSPSAVEPAGGSVEEFAEFVRKDREAAAQLVKLANIKPQ